MSLYKELQFTTAAIRNFNLYSLLPSFANNTWSTTGSLSTSREYAGGFGTINSAVVMAGDNGAGTRLNITDVYNGSTWAVSGTYVTVASDPAGVGIFNAGLGIGGYVPGITATCAKFNGTAWSSTTSLGTATDNTGAAGIQSSAVMFGGEGPGVTAAANKFDGTTWSSTGSLNTARRYCSGFGIQGSAIAVGGGTPTALTSTEFFNGTTWSSSSAVLSVAKFSGAAAGTRNAGKFIGGQNGSSVEQSVCENFNGLVWLIAPSLSIARTYVSHQRMGTQNTALVAGGGLGAGGVLGSAEKFVGQPPIDIRMTFVSEDNEYIESLNTNFSATKAGYLVIETLLRANAGKDPLEITDLNTLGKVDAGDGAWSASGSLATARAGSPASIGIVGSGLLIGGSTGSASASGESFNGSTWSALANSLNTARFYVSGAGLRTAGLTFGGTTTGSNHVTNTEKFDGTSWTNSGGLGTGRESPGSAGVMNAALAIGGYTGASSSIVEKFNGSVWTATGSLNTAGSYFASGAFGAQNATMRMGGFSSSAIVEKFNGSTWATINSLNSGAQSGSGSGGSNSVTLSNGFSGGNAVVTCSRFNGTNWIAAGSLANARFEGAGFGNTTKSVVACGSDGSTRQLNSQVFATALTDPSGVTSYGTLSY